MPSISSRSAPYQAKNGVTAARCAAAARSRSTSAAAVASTPSGRPGPPPRTGCPASPAGTSSPISASTVGAMSLSCRYWARRVLGDSNHPRSTPGPLTAARCSRGAGSPTLPATPSTSSVLPCGRDASIVPSARSTAASPWCRPPDPAGSEPRSTTVSGQPANSGPGRSGRDGTYRSTMPCRSATARAAPLPTAAAHGTASPNVPGRAPNRRPALNVYSAGRSGTLAVTPSGIPVGDSWSADLDRRRQPAHATGGAPPGAPTTITGPGAAVATRTSALAGPAGNPTRAPAAIAQEHSPHAPSVRTRCSPSGHLPASERPQRDTTRVADPVPTAQAGASRSAFEEQTCSLATGFFLKS